MLLLANLSSLIRPFYISAQIELRALRPENFFDSFTKIGHTSSLKSNISRPVSHKMEGKPVISHSLHLFSVATHSVVHTFSTHIFYTRHVTLKADYSVQRGLPGHRCFFPAAGQPFSHFSTHRKELH